MMGSVSGRFWVGVGVAALVGVFSASCVSEERSADPPTSTVIVEPSGFRSFPVPLSEVWPEEERSRLPLQRMVALGPSGLLLGSVKDLGESFAWLVADVGSGEWERVESPPVDGVMVTWGLVSVGRDAVLIAAVCPEGGRLSEEDDYETCAPAYSGVGVWVFDHTDREWSETTFLTPEDLDVRPDLVMVRPVGVADSRVFVDVAPGSLHQPSTVWSVDVANGEISREADVPAGVSVDCVTRSGALVGADRRDDVTSTSLGGIDPGEEVEPMPAAPIVVSEDGSTWVTPDQLNPSILHLLGCGDDTFSVIGSGDGTPEDFRWTEVSTDGQIIADSNPAAELAGQDRFTNSLIIGTGTSILGFVSGRSGLDMNSTLDVSVIATDRGPVLTHQFTDADYLVIDAAVRLADGSIAVLVYLPVPNHQEDDQQPGLMVPDHENTRLEVLVAR